ncbi:MAG: hypothetical protein IJ751_03950 [Oscillospiraceae bacterium]|nr:hypothetical protein [Oscillospiraceae bacterium]
MPQEQTLPALALVGQRLGMLTQKLRGFDRQLLSAANSTNSAAKTVSQALRTTASATKAVLTLMSFDEINRLREKTVSSRSGSRKSASGSAGAKTKTGPSLDLNLDNLPDLTRPARNLGQSFWNEFSAGVTAAGDSAVGKGIFARVASGLAAGWGDLKRWVKERIWEPIQSAFTSMTGLDLNIGAKLAASPILLWEAFRAGWGAPVVEIFNTLHSGAATLWESFRATWGTPGVSISNRLASSAAILWAGFQTGWGSRSVSILNHLVSSAAALWSGFRTGWGSRSVSIVNTLTNSAATLWSNFKSGWIGKRLGLTVTYSTSVGAVKRAVYKALGLAGWPSISFAARGGVFRSATLTMLGEAGTEAVVPLENNTGWMDIMAEKLGQRMGGGSQPITVYVTLDGRVVAQSVVNTVNADTRRNGVSPFIL